MTDLDDLSYKVRVWEITNYTGARATTYRVRWKVGDEEFKESFKKRPQADAFRSQLLQAQSRGEGFSKSQGLPVSMLRQERTEVSWYDFVCRYVDHKWPDISAKHRGNIAFALMMATRATFTTDRGRPDDALLRTALRKWAFSTTYRAAANRPDDITLALNWVARNSVNVSQLSDPRRAAALAKAATTKVDGSKAAISTRRRNHSILKAALRYAVDEGLLAGNPIPELEATTSRSVHQVDRRCVVNPTQARALLAAVRRYGHEHTEGRADRKSGPRMVAFFGAMYYSGLRPEEAVNLFKHNLSLPTPRKVADDAGGEALVYDWGELHLDEVTPDARPEFTDNGTSRDRRRKLKQREEGEYRPVPCPPELTRLLWEHLEVFGTDVDGRLFTGIGGKPLATITYRRAWSWAREQALTEAEHRSPLAGSPYALRHTCVSSWLNAGVSETLVSQWAGHSVAVLKKIYAKCLVGEEDRAKEQISEMLRRG